MVDRPDVVGPWASGANPVSRVSATNYRIAQYSFGAGKHATVGRDIPKRQTTAASS